MCVYIYTCIYAYIPATCRGSNYALLRADPWTKLARKDYGAEDMFVLFGQRAARSQMLPRPANVGSGTDGRLSGRNSARCFGFVHTYLAVCLGNEQNLAISPE